MDIENQEVQNDDVQTENEQTEETLAETMFPEAFDDEENAVEETEPSEASDAPVVQVEETAEETTNEEMSEDEMPDGLGEKAQERFRTLANENRTFREKEKEWAQMSESVNEMRSMMQESCNNTDEVLQLFDYAKSVKNQDWETAERYLREQVLQFSMMSGRKLDVNVFGDYGDLQDKIDNYELSEEDARQIAAARYQQQALATAQQQAQQAQQQQAQQQAQQQQAIQEINALSAQWAQTDLRWQEREGQLMDFIRNTLRNEPPHKWVAGLQYYYEGLKRQAIAKPSPSPLRPRPSAQPHQEPQNTAEAMFGDLNIL